MTSRLADLTDLDGEGAAWGAGGLLASLVVGAVVEPYRRSIGLENVAIVYLLVVVAAATIGGRAAGLISALSAALSYDYFLTTPYHTLAIDSASQIITVVLLFVVGIVASVGARARRQARQRAAAEVHGQTDTIRLLHTVLAAVAGGQDVDRVAAEGIRDLLDAERVLVARQGRMATT
jgi:K+-sensing histidine kinase KdpD